jgi:hypothetical protein
MTIGPKIVDFQFATTKNVRGLALDEVIKRECRQRAVSAGAVKWECRYFGAVDFTDDERTHTVQLTLIFD